jgi:hypothetical protein
MNEEKKKILDKINLLIDKRKDELLQRFPHIHEIEDGIIIRFFTNWNNCSNNEEVRYKRFVNESDDDDITVLHFIPKGTKLELMKHEYINSIICINGRIKIKIDSEAFILESNKKLYLPNNEFEAYAFEDTYVITQNK